MRVPAQDQFFLFYFLVIAYFWIIKNSSKKIEKYFFPVGKIQEIEYTFSVAKEIVYSLVILNQRDI